MSFRIRHHSFFRQPSHQITAARLSYDGVDTKIEGIDWGTNISDLPDMNLMGGIGGGKRIYARKGERKKIGDADVEAVLYGCYKDRLEAVQIHFRHSRNFAKLKEMLFRIYGPSRRPVRSMETYHWYGKQVSVFLAYNQILEKGAIGYTFMPIYREEREDGKRAHKKRKEMAEYFKNLKIYAPQLVGSRMEGKKVIPEWGYKQNPRGWGNGYRREEKGVFRSR